MGKQAQYGGGWEEIKHKHENSHKTNEFLVKNNVFPETGWGRN